jgi:hypothetical protein
MSRKGKTLHRKVVANQMQMLDRRPEEDEPVIEADEDFPI